MPTIGDRLAGRYRLDALIGSGGFATVYRARDLRLERDVAVKVLLAGHATDPIVAARFAQEARVLAAIGHPNVVAIHDVDPGDAESAEASFLVMELCEGGSLADRLASSENATLDPGELVPILVDVAAGLAALHAIGIVHRDVKPSNILLSDGRARIADLGIAVAGPSELTTAGSTIGTLAYLAPEQVAGEPASPASDVHALGVVAFVGLTGGLPRPAGSVADVVAASTLPVSPASAVRPDLGSAFDALLAQALAADPSRRPTAADFGMRLAAALERWRTDPGSAAQPAGASAGVGTADATTLVAIALPPRPDATSAPAAAQSRVSWPTVAAGGLALALGLGLVAVLVLGSGGRIGTSSPSNGGATATAPRTADPPSPSAPSPAPTPVPFSDDAAFSEAAAASDAMRSAIRDARGAGGLNGKEPKELEKVLARFDRALERRDAGAAREEAGTLALEVAGRIAEGTVAEGAGIALGSAAARLVAAADALPD